MKFLTLLHEWAGEHKKMVTAILGAIAALVPADLLSDTTKQELISLAVAFIVGQGVADAGKEAKKIELAGKVAAVDAADSAAKV